MYTQEHILIQACAQINLYIVDMYECILIHASTQVYISYMSTQYIFMYLHKDIFTGTHTCIHTQVHKCTHAQIHMLTYRYMHKHMHTHKAYT